MKRIFYQEVECSCVVSHLIKHNPSSIYLFKVKNAGREDVLFVCNILKLAKSLSYKIFFNEIDNQKELRLVTDVKY